MVRNIIAQHVYHNNERVKLNLMMNYEDILEEFGKFWISAIPKKSTLKSKCNTKCRLAIVYKSKKNIVDVAKDITSKEVNDPESYMYPENGVRNTDTDNEDSMELEDKELNDVNDPESYLYFVFSGGESSKETSCPETDDFWLYTLKIDDVEKNLVSYDNCSNDTPKNRRFIKDNTKTENWLKLLIKGNKVLYLKSEMDDNATKKLHASFINEKLDYELIGQNNDEFTLTGKQGKWVYKCDKNGLGSKSRGKMCDAFYESSENPKENSFKMDQKVEIDEFDRNTEKFLTLKVSKDSVKIKWKCECDPKKRLFFLKSKTKKKCKCKKRVTRKKVPAVDAAKEEWDRFVQSSAEREGGGK